MLKIAITEQGDSDSQNKDQKTVTNKIDRTTRQFIFFKDQMEIVDKNTVVHVNPISDLTTFEESLEPVSLPE